MQMSVPRGREAKGIFAHSCSKIPQIIRCCRSRRSNLEACVIVKVLNGKNPGAAPGFFLMAQCRERVARENVNTMQRFYIKTASSVAVDAMKKLEERISGTAVVQ